MQEPEVAFGSRSEDLDEERLGKFRQKLAEGHQDFVAVELRNRDAFRRRLHDDYGAGLDLMPALHAMCLEALDWANDELHERLDEDDSGDWKKFLQLMAGLTARALLAYDETSWLLRGGYPGGAWSRIRTLHELYVAGAVIAKYGNPEGEYPELVDRYLLHREVFTSKTATALLATDPSNLASILSEDVLAVLNRRRADLLEHFGRGFKESWGWAAPVVGQGKQPSLGELSRIVSPQLQYFYGLASSHIHAGSEGWHDNMVAREHGTVLAAGPTNVNLLLPAAVASHLLVAVSELAIPTRIVSAHGDVVDTGAYFIWALEDLTRRFTGAISDGEERVRAKEEAFQEALHSTDSPAGRGD